MNKMQIGPGHKNLRKGRVSIANRIYFITVVCKGREERFRDFHIASQTCRVMAQATTWSDAHLMAWTLMPDHYHALIQLGEKASLQSVMRRANSVLAIAANKAAHRSGQVWQSAYYDRAMRSPEQIMTAARYLIANPLRANLVKNAGDYPFWDAIWLSGPIATTCRSQLAGDRIDVASKLAPTCSV